MLYFRAPKSYTGEDMLEFHIHGSNATKKKMLEVLEKIPQFREAEPVSTF